MKPLTPAQVDQERALEARRVVEAYQVAYTRAEAVLEQAKATGDRADIRISERLAQEALEQLLAAQDHEDRVQGRWRPVRPGGGHR